MYKNCKYKCEKPSVSIQRVRPIVNDTSKTAKINFINSGAVDIIRTAYYIRGPELMKLIFAVLDVSLTMGLTRCYKTEGFFTFITIIIPVIITIIPMS